MTRQVVIKKEELRTSEATTSSGYIMVGNKGNYMLARDCEGKFIWVRFNPPKVTKPVKKYDTLKEALEDKINDGYDVISVDESDDLEEFLN